MSDLDVLRHSVTKDDYTDVKKDGAFRVLLPFAFGEGLLPDGLPAAVPGWWSPQRDLTLRATVLHEGMWASAVGILATKLAALGWDITGDVPLRKQRGSDLLTYADHGNGWVSFITKLAIDYSTTDNGGFMEVIHASSARGSRVMGIEVLDSLRCTRTGDPEIPVVYRDKRGGLHEMRAHQVRAFVDMPSSGAIWNGVGLCAASRAYKAIVKLAAMDQFLIEKVTGRRALALHFIGGVSPQTLKSIVATADADAVAKGIQHYLGALLAAVGGDTPVSLASLPLAEIPNGFDRKEEWDIALLTFADALGLDPADLQPLSGQGLGTGAQSEVQANKAKGKGFASLRQSLVHTLNAFVLSAGTTFAWSERDLQDQKAKADIDDKKTDTAVKAIENGIMVAQTAAQWLVDEEVFPDTILPQGDATPDLTISDSDGKDTPAPELAAMAAVMPAAIKEALTGGRAYVTVDGRRVPISETDIRPLLLQAIREIQEDWEGGETPQPTGVPVA